MVWLRGQLGTRGWVYYRAAEIINPDKTLVVKTGYGNFECYVDLKTPRDGIIESKVIDRMRLREDTTRDQLWDWVNNR